MDTGKGKNGSIGLSYPMLARSNYTTWALKMKVFMQAQGVWNAVSPSDDKAIVDDKNDKVAMAMMYQGLPEDMLLSVAQKKTAKEIWEAVKNLCQGSDKVKGARVQTLKSEFEAISMKEGEQVDDFYMRINGLVTNIRTLGEEMSESYVVKKFLRSVPSKFLQITSTMEQFGNLDTMTMEEAVGSLKAHEERLRGKSDNSESQLLLTKEEWERREESENKLLLTKEEWMKRTNTGGPSNYRGRGRDKSTVKCYNCNIYGHYASECRKPKKNRDTKQETNMIMVDDDEPALLLAKHDKEEPELKLLHEERVVSSLLPKTGGKDSESNI